MAWGYLYVHYWSLGLIKCGLFFRGGRRVSEMTRMYGSWFKFDKRKHLLLQLTNRKVEAQIVDKREGIVDVTISSIQKVGNVTLVGVSFG